MNFYEGSSPIFLYIIWTIPILITCNEVMEMKVIITKGKHHDECKKVCYDYILNKYRKEIFDIKQEKKRVNSDESDIRPREY
jgi:hypothetical protein